MSAFVNSAYENNELDILEAGHRADDPLKNKEIESNKKSRSLTVGYEALDHFVSKHQRAFKVFLLTLINVLILIYFIFATLYWRNNNSEDGYNWCHGYGMLIILFAFTYGGILYHFVVKRFLGQTFVSCSRPLRYRIRSFRNRKYGDAVIQTTIYTCIFGAIIVFLIFDTVGSRERLLSLIGIVILLSCGRIFSKHPDRIKWRPVLSGLTLQFVFGLITIRWKVGRTIFQCISDKVATFLDFASSGISFVFSQWALDENVFAFASLSVIYYFSFIIQILYYLGVMQWIILRLGQFLQGITGASICESVVCASNTFIGMSESPLIIKPYLSKLTTSEIHTVMCAGFGTVSGTVLAAYVKFGANPAHLITATLMAVPAALCFSKLFYPETEEIMVTGDNVHLEKSQDSSLMDAATKGAMAAIPLVMGIIANIIAFVSFIALLNSLLAWLCSLIGYENITFEWILSRIFMPLSWIIGVPWDKCEYVGTLIGLKTVVNEFVAYQKLGEFKRENKIFGRTEAIATFAICGFANPGSVGIMLSILTSLAPDTREKITNTIMRAFLAGCAVCFLTASTAGLLMDDEFVLGAMNSTATNTTAS
nr:PREDICTED: solute carrier family 28 member 3-like isoform X1 [Megachile rotundata]